jgi:hypothetical protein
MERLNEQLKDSPNDLTLLKQRAAAYVYLKNHDQAFLDLNHVLQLDPTNIWALLARSQEYLLLKKNEEALADADAALKLCSGNRTPYLMQRTICSYMLGKDADAAADCTEILTRCPSATETEKLIAVTNRAELFCRLGKYDQSLADCKKALAIDPRGAGGAAYYWRAQALKALKDDAGARVAETKSQEIGYVDTGRVIADVNTLIYDHMFDPVQKRFSHRIDTKHFVFFFNSDQGLASTIAKFSECFLSHVDSDLFKVKWSAPVNVYMMPDKASQYTFLKEQMNNDQDVWGTCIPNRNAMVFYTQSGFGTVAHIIFAQVSLNTPIHVDRFAGIDAFFEKIYGYQQGVLSALYWGYQNPWRLKRVEKEIPNLTLVDVIALSQDPKVDHQSEERLVAMFLYDSNLFKKYIDLAIADDRKGYGTVLEAAFDKPIAAIEPQWHEYLIGISKNLATLEENPTSEFFLSKVDFDKFVKEHSKIFVNFERHLSSNLSAHDQTAAAVPSTNKPGVLPRGWSRAGSHPSEYEMGMTRDATHSGTTSGYLKSIAAKTNGFGTLMQMFQADRFRGRKVQLTCWTKTENVDSWAGAWIRVDGPERGGGSLSFDNMEDRPIKGTTDWTKREITLNVPVNGANIDFGVLLSGRGKVWVDDFEFQDVGPCTTAAQPTKQVKPNYVNDDALNLNFEDGSK